MANQTPVAVTTKLMNTAANKPAFSVQDTNGTIVISTNGSTDRLLLDIENADDAAVTLTMQAPTGVPQANLAEELTTQLAATGNAGDSKLWGPFESQKVCHADGTIKIGIQAATGSPNLKIRAIAPQKM